LGIHVSDCDFLGIHVSDCDFFWEYTLWILGILNRKKTTTTSTLKLKMCTCELKKVEVEKFLNQCPRVGLQMYIKKGKSFNDYARDQMLASRFIYNNPKVIRPSSVAFVMPISKRGWRRVEDYQVGLPRLDPGEQYTGKYTDLVE
jgi:hypothetical protein